MFIQKKSDNLNIVGRHYKIKENMLYKKLLYKEILLPLSSRSNLLDLKTCNPAQMFRL